MAVYRSITGVQYHPANVLFPMMSCPVCPIPLFSTITSCVCDRQLIPTASIKSPSLNAIDGAATLRLYDTCMCVSSFVCLCVCSGIDDSINGYKQPVLILYPSGKDRDRDRDGDKRRERDRGGTFKSHQKRAPPPLSKPPSRAPRSRKSKSPSRPNRARLDVDRVETNSTPEGSGRFRDLRDSKLGQNCEGVASELCRRGGRVRTGVYQTSELTSLVSTKSQPEQRRIGRSQSAERRVGRSLSGERQSAADRSRFKATFV